MTILKERAIDIISRRPEEKLYYVVQFLESVEGLSEKGVKMLERKALEDLQRFRKRSDVEIDYKAELAAIREEKYAGID